MDAIQNPILKGFYPDPTICRVGEDFYLATSSFSFFPGVPIFHSRDLVHWAQIGHAIHRPDQIELAPEHISGGLFAPTLRYHDGKFYVIVQNSDIGTGLAGTTLVVTADDPAGPWSDPVYLEDCGGDPSLFWDTDGTVYCQYSLLVAENRQVINKGIYHHRVDLTTGKRLSEPLYLWSGAAADAYCPEAPHIYKIGPWYYLLIAEGGTEHFHAVTIARSASVNGPCWQSHLDPPAHVQALPHLQRGPRGPGGYASRGMVYGDAGLQTIWRLSQESGPGDIPGTGHLGGWLARCLSRQR